jgi:site-specific DNA-methyltransferase (adenine-specific)
LANSKIGDVWISYYLDDIITVRDKDWEKLASYFSIPENIKDIDFTKIKLNNQEKLAIHKKNMVLPLFQ